MSKAFQELCMLIKASVLDVISAFKLESCRKHLNLQVGLGLDPKYGGGIPKVRGTGRGSCEPHEQKSQKTAGLNGKIEHVLKQNRNINPSN